MADATYGAKQAPNPDVRFRTDRAGDVDTPYHKDADRAALLSAISAATAALGTQTTLAAILSTLQAQSSLAVSLWTDNSGAYLVRQDIIDEDTGVITIRWTNASGTVATPGAGLRPVANEESLHTQAFTYRATAGGTGYSTNDIIQRVVVMDLNTSPATVVSSVWVNITTGAVMGTAPSMANLQPAPEGLPANAATETTLSAISGKLPATLGAKLAALSLGVALANEQEDMLQAIADMAANYLANADTPADVTSPEPTSVTVSIASGASLSGAIAIRGALSGIIMPAGWDAAGLTFQVSMDNTNFSNLYADGVEFTVASAAVAAGRAVSLPLNNFLGWRYVKVRSGTAASPVDQTAARNLTLALAG